MLRKLKPSKSKKLAKAKADKYFSLFIRRRDTAPNGIGQCITCSNWYSFESMDCGHFITRDNEPVRYDERNCNAQCRRCNRFKSGKQYEHGQAIDRKWGEGAADELLQKSKMRSGRKKHDYDWIAREYHQRIKQM